MKRILYFLLLLASFSACGQSTKLDFVAPAGNVTPASPFDNITGWWRADTFTGSPGSYSLTDKTSNGHNMVQQVGTMTAGTAGNGQARFVCSGASLSSTLELKSWPITIVTVGKRANNTPTGLFGHDLGGSSANSLWVGYEQTGDNNSFYAYNNNAAINATAEYGADAVYLVRLGFGTRVTIINGLIQADMTRAGITQTNKVAVAIGTGYRNLNFDWYETLVWDRVLTVAEIDKVHTYLNSRYGFSIPLWSSYTPVKALSFHGQSNSDGRGDRGAGDANIPVQYRSSLSNVKEFSGSAFSTMNLSTNTFFSSTGGQDDAGYIGQELTAARDYANSTGETIYVTKYAQGDTFLAYQASAGNGYWINETSDTQGNARYLFGGSMTYWWAAMRVHQQNSRLPVCKGVVFYQGESDATDLTSANAYYTNGVTFINALRAEMGLGAVKIFIVRIHVDIDIGQQPYKATVRTKEAALAADMIDVALESVDSYSLRDGAHIDVAGQIALGQSLATKF